MLIVVCWYHREILVQWTTRDSGTPTVSYGTESGNYNLSASGTSHTYNASDLCGSPANDTAYVNPGSLHIVKLKGLEYSTEYFYIFGDAVRHLHLSAASHNSLAVLLIFGISAST